MLKIAPDGAQLGSVPITAASLGYGRGHIYARTIGDAVLEVIP